MKLYLGIDSGGTKASYVLADDARELARTHSGSIKRMRVDAELAEANLTGALEELCRLSGVDLGHVTHTCIGTAGETVPLVTGWLEEHVRAHVGGTREICGDVEIALDAAFPGAAGVLVLAGTGSNVVGRDAAGRLTTAGGYGPLLADQGSGQRIGYTAMRRMMLAHDAGRTTTLQAAILGHWALGDLNELVAFVHTVPPPDIAALTQVVLREALAGDRVAGEVLAQEGEDLGHLVALVIERLVAAPPAELPSVAFAGSIMEHVTPVRQALLASLRDRFPRLAALDGVVDPLLGALWRARQGPPAADAFRMSACGT